MADDKSAEAHDEAYNTRLANPDETRLDSVADAINHTRASVNCEKDRGKRGAAG
jgi:hypothetical protein